MSDGIAKPLPTSARLSLGRSGTSVPTVDHLRFQLDHALARDAVHTPLDTACLTRALHERNLTPVLLHSNAADRKTYLRRPDLGRTLHPDSIAALQNAVLSTEAPTNAVISTESPIPSVILAEGLKGRSGETPVFGSATEPLTQHMVLFLLADGLSALALERHALPLLDAVFPLIPTPYALLPVLHNARVALGDQIGHLLHAQITVLLIGERPGLSSPDSLGVYITWNPQPGKTTDAERNCISNIRGDEGLSYAEAAHRIAHYLREAQRLHTTGIALKDPVPALDLPISERIPL